jgi:hypothetical protein
LYKDSLSRGGILHFKVTFETWLRGQTPSWWTGKHSVLVFAENERIAKQIAEQYENHEFPGGQQGLGAILKIDLATNEDMRRYSSISAIS